MFEVNVFGLAYMTKAVLPGMRARRSEDRQHLFDGRPDRLSGDRLLLYATKFAVEGLSEALAKERAALGIKVIAVAACPFRTDWAGRSSKTP